MKAKAIESWQKRKIYAIANALGVSADELLVDVVDHASSGVASELSAAIEDLPRDEKMRVLKVISALLDR